MRSKTGKGNNVSGAVKSLVITLCFLVVAAGAFFVAGSSFYETAKHSVNSTIEQGTPIGSYNDINEEDRPCDGNIDRSDLPRIVKGCAYGRLTCDAMKFSSLIYYGDTKAILAKGLGQNCRSGLPGEGKMILVGGHDVGCLDDIEKVAKGDEIKVSTMYGNFSYKVTKIKVSDAAYIKEKDLEKDGEKLVLYTCYPIGNVLDDNPKRYYVIAEKTGGPVMVGGDNEQ